MDVKMPGLDGFEATRILKAQPRFATLPIILMSARFDRRLMAFALQSGALDLLPKPLDKVALPDRLWNALGRR